ncbi:ABC transporter permease subunit [Flavobacteriaceae bacterium Ap0902]|nr:ABC transporter permease subunit [Flavobacteriaceae bacterium Ap0902]
MNEFWSRRTYFFELFSEHLLISFAALVLVAILGIGVGIFVFYNQKARAFIMPTVNFLYTIPSIAMFGILIPLVGIGLKNALIVLVLYGLLPIVRNTYSGLKAVPQNYVEAAKGLGSTPIQLFKNIYFPLSLPSILSGMRVTTVMVIALAGLAALVGAGGLGQAIFRGLNTMNTPLIVIGSLGVSVFAILGDQFVAVFEKNNRLQRLVSHNIQSRDRNFIRLNVLVLALLVVGAILYLNPFTTTNDKHITVASKPTSEQFILGEIIAQTIENETDIEVNRNFGIGGGTNNMHPAMLNGNIDLYVEYTSTATMNVLNIEAEKARDLSLEEINQMYQEQFNLTWIGLLGLNNKYALAISQQDAREQNIHTFSDLAKHSSNYTLGAEFDFFERSDAYRGLVKTYPFNFKRVEEMDINLRYKAFEDGRINAVDAFTTDAQIEALDLRILEDDQNYFPEYEAGIIVRDEILKSYPELQTILAQFNGKISTEAMREMNYKVEILGQSPQQVASKFLKDFK